MRIPHSYLNFIRYSLNPKEELAFNYEEINWNDYLQFCNRQSILGVVYAGLVRANRKIPQNVLFDWIGAVENIKAQNKLVNIRLATISKWFQSKGKRCVVLKGQVNGLMYPNPELRCPGDIDIWVDGEDVEIIKMVKKYFPNVHYSLHHVKMTAFKDVSVEVHYSPAHLRKWWKDKDLQEYINLTKDIQFENKICFGDIEIGSLTDKCNMVYQMLHMYGHYFTSRNNFKQLVDYYYLMKREFNDSEKNEIRSILNRIGIMKYAEGIMWIMHEILGLEENMLIATPNEKFGRVLLADTLTYGIENRRNIKDILIRRIMDNFHLMRFFPIEVMVGPLYLVWHQWWKFEMTLKLTK